MKINDRDRKVIFLKDHPDHLREGVHLAMIETSGQNECDVETDHKGQMLSVKHSDLVKCVQESSLRDNYKASESSAFEEKVKWNLMDDSSPEFEYEDDGWVTCYVVHYNRLHEILKWDGKDWWEISGYLSKPDTKVNKKGWPDFWSYMPDAPHKEDL